LEDGTAELPDPDLLDRASALGRVLYSQDEDLLAEANRRQTLGIPFAGLIYGHQLQVTVGMRVRDLEHITKATDPGELQDRVLYLPI